MPVGRANRPSYIRSTYIHTYVHCMAYVTCTTTLRKIRAWLIGIAHLSRDNIPTSTGSQERRVGSNSRIVSAYLPSTRPHTICDLFVRMELLFTRNGLLGRRRQDKLRADIGAQVLRQTLPVLIYSVYLPSVDLPSLAFFTVC